MDDYNCQTLNTILHENMHCFQDQVIDGTIQIDDLQLTSEYQANSYTNSIVFQNGKGQWGSQYMTGETANGYYMYYFQATERDAYRTAEEKTASILQELSGKYGTEASFETYTKSMATTGYQAMEQKAILEFQNPNFEKDLNQVLQNQYFGTNVEVDKNTEEAVKAEMIATYQNLYEQLGESTAANEDAKMSFDPRPVSLEEYNQEKVELADLLSHFALFSAQDEDGEYNVVKVMTIHTAKGLEFDTVFVPGLVEGQFPSSRLRNEDEYEEERRLLYVAMTRAKNMLYLSTYRKKDGRFAARPSAFLSDIDTNLLDCINNSRVLIRGVTEQMLPKVVFEVGDKVRHKVFGTGEIVKVDKVTQTYEIQFENIRGTRRLMFRAELGNVEN